MKAICSVQLADGSHCKRLPISNGKCFWHSEISKTDDSFKKYYPSYDNLKEVIESERPNLEKVFFGRGPLISGNFSNLNLEGAQFHFTDLTDSQFEKANLKSSFFNNVILERANFKEAKLDKAGIDKSNLRKATLDRASLINTKISECNLSYASCIGTSFRSAKLVFSNLFKTDFTNAIFSNKGTQLKYCNTQEPYLEEYLKKKIISWVKSDDKSDALKVIQFLANRLEKKDFESLIRQVSISLKNAYDSARYRSNFNQMADVYEFLARLYKTTNYLPSIIALPGKSEINEKQPIIKLRATLLNNEIRLRDLLDFCSQLNDLLINIQLANEYSKDIIAPKIVYISLQSPSELWIIGAVGSSLIVISKLISMWMDIYLKGIQIEKEQRDLDGKIIALENLKLDNKLKALEYKEKIKSEIDIPEEKASSLSNSINIYFSNIINSPTFLDHKITINNEDFIIKRQVEKIEYHDSTNKLR